MLFMSPAMRHFSAIAVLLALSACAAPSPEPPDPPSSRSTNSPSEVVPSVAASLERLDDLHPSPSRSPEPDFGPALDRASEHVSSSHASAQSRVLGWQPALPEQPDYASILDSDRRIAGSLSLGKTSSGRLERAARLPHDGSHHAVFESHRDRRTHYGTDEMIRLVQDVAAEVADDHPGSTLKVGNISRRGGGDIRWSHSHNSGRDVDFAFYCRRAEDGTPVEAPELVAFDDEGHSVDPPGLRFDVARNWALVESLVTHPTVDIQRIFISNALRETLVAHAQSRGVEETIVERADAVMRQPLSAPPHNDHFHVRITCARDDRLEGCLNYGPRWEWADWHQRDLLARSRALRRGLEASDVETRLAVLDELERIESPYAPEIALLEGRNDPRDDVQWRALEVASEVAWWSGTAVRAAIRWIGDPGTTLEAKRMLYEILRRSRDPMGYRFALSRLLSRWGTPEEYRLAANALRHAMRPGFVEPLLDAMARRHPEVRAEIAVVLRRITGRLDGVDWRAASFHPRRGALREWHQWWKTHRDERRRDWLLESFRARGFEGERLTSMGSIGPMISMLRDTPDPVAYNANRLLHRLTDQWVPLEGWSQARLHRHWTNWWDANRSEVLESSRASVGP